MRNQIKEHLEHHQRRHAVAHRDIEQAHQPFHHQDDGGDKDRHQEGGHDLAQKITIDSFHEFVYR